jgi:hypothetical protein
MVQTDANPGGLPKSVRQSSTPPVGGDRQQR